MADATTHSAGIHDVAVVGGGLAGLSAACALAESGYRVHLIERRPYVGGRASSYEHPGTGEVVDNCQHVLLGCCTNLIAFYKQLGVADQIRWFDRITFIEPGGRQSLLRPGLLPAPLHNAMAFLQSSALSLADKVAISRGMMSFLQGVPADSGENFASWLARHGQTQRAIDRFWNPVLVSALNEDLDRVSVHYAAMVFRTSFMQSEQAGCMGVPTIPLSELYSHAVSFIEAHGGQVTLRKSVDSFAYDEHTRRWRLGFEGGNVEADAVVLAVPFESMQKLYPLLPPPAEETSEITPGTARTFSAFADHRHPPVVRSRDYGSGSRRPARYHDSMDVQQDPPAAAATQRRRRQLSRVSGECVEDPGANVTSGDTRSCAA